MNNQFGKLSKLHIRTAYREEKTILEDVSFTAPFKIMHPFYEKKDFMTVMLLTASAGIMAGDRQEIDVCVRENSNMEFVSQAYEKIHRMEKDCAKRQVLYAFASYSICRFRLSVYSGCGTRERNFTVCFL